MKRLLHLSDLHFGRTRPDLLDPLIDRIHGLAPDLVVISGDFTQRARDWQFRQAREFLDRIAHPVLAVPGNHDTPLENLFIRLLMPWHRYRRFIHADLEPVWEDETILVAGVNTANPYDWQRGRIGQRAIDRIDRIFRDKGDRLSVAVLHHPLEHGPGEDRRLMRGARRALSVFGAHGTDLVLSGHLHNTRIAPFSAEPGVLFVQAGTGLSTRLRGEENRFNLLRIERDAVEIDRYSAAEHPWYDLIDTATFRREDGGWRRLDAQST